MAYWGNIYYEFRDFQDRRYLVEFFDTEGSVESFEIKNAPPEPISINRVGGNKDSWDDSVILAQQMTFRFYVEYNDLQVIDPILCSPYRQWGAKVTLLDPIELQIFRGYLKTENCIRRYDPEPRNAVKIELCAVDGLAELKDVDFKNYIPTGEQDYPGIITLLRAVKSAVTPLALQLPFLVKLSTYEENYMNPSDCLLEKVYCNLSRFYKGAKGDIYTKDVEFISCYDVIEYVLKPFNCKLFVTPEYFCIVNFYEKNGGYHFRYGWDLILDETQGPYAPETGVSDVTNYFFKTDAELQKIQPLRSILVEVNNNDEGETPQDLGDDGAWTYTGWSSHSSDDGVLELKMTDMGQPHMVLNTPLDLIVHPGNEVLRVQFSYRLTSYVEDKKSESQLQMVVRIQKPTGVWTDVVRSAENAYPKDTWQRFDSYVSNLFFLRGDGEYNVLIGLDSKTGGKHFKSLTLEIKDIKLSQYNVTTGYSFDPLFREVGRQFYQTNGDWHSFEDVKTSLYLFDAEVISDDGALLVIDGGQIKTTSQWNPYGESLQISIVDLFSRNILVNRSIYKDYIRMNIVDRNYVIQHENLLKISNCIFVQNSYDRAYQLMFLEFELIEIISGSDTYHPYDQVNGGTRKTYADYSPIVEVTGEDKLPTFQPQYIEETKDIFNIGFEEEVHGFNIGDVIRAEYDEFGVLKYAKAKADTKEHAKVIGIVTEVVDEYEFKYAAIGKYIGRELLEENIGSGDFEILEGSFYYLSATEDGRITDKPTFEETGVEVVVGIGTDLGLKVANIPKEVDMAAASSVGIPIYLHWENSDIQDSDSYTEESLESSDSSGYVYYPSDYDKALLELPSDIDCVYGVTLKESSGEILIKKFVTDPGVPNTTFLAAGIWFFQTYIRCSTVIGLSIKIYVYKRDEFGVETELFSFTQKLDDDSEIPKSYKYAFVGDNYILKKTDRLVFAYCAINSKEIFQSIELFVESITPTNVRVPFSIDLLATEIGGLTEIETDKSVQGTGKESDPITLVNDEEAPGNDKYYGTNEVGEKGFYDLPEEFNPLEVIEGAITNIEYGGLYNHYAIQDIRNMAPVGWHVATDSDWDALITAVGGNFVAGGVLKEVDTKYWYAPNVDATNEYGFNARGSGGRIDLDGSYSSIRVFGRYWGANVTPVEYQISYNTATVLKTTYSSDDKQYGFAVRWVKDNSTDPGVIRGNDGKVYPTTKIGNQVWTACNVLETRFRNGDVIDGPFFGDSEWIALETPAYCVYDDEPDNASTGKVDIIHNNTKNIQGGTSGERYHHTKDEIGTHVYEANIDGKQYARKDGTWVEVEAGGGGIDDIYIEPDPTFPIDYLYKEVDSVQTLITDIPKADGVVAGGHISWLGGLTYQIDPTAWYKAGDLYSIKPDTDIMTLTLNPADSGDDRIDALVLNIDNGFTFIEGTPSANPMRPTIDAGTDVFLTEVYIAAGATEPDPVPTNEIVYNENVEWTVTSSGVVVNPDDTTEHYQGSKSIEVGSIGNYDYIQFEAGSGDTFNVEDWENIIANLKLKANLDTRKSKLAVVFLLDGVAINNPTNFDITGNTTNWQNLALPFSRINFFGTEFNQIRFYFYKTTGGDITGFYLDYIKLEIGIEQPPVVNTSVQLIGDVLANGYTGTPIPTNLKIVNANVGQFGDATNVPKITVDGKGRVTAIENVAVTIPPSITPTSDATPVDADEVVSLRGTSWLKTTWTVLKAFLKTYFDGVYSAINHTHTFLSLTDTPAAYTGMAGKVAKVNVGENAIEFGDPGAGATTFLALTDTPAAYTGQAGKYPKVNVGETGLEFDIPGAGDFALKALSNLESVAINTSLISDTDSTYDLGSSTKYWANLYSDNGYFSEKIGVTTTSPICRLDLGDNLNNFPLFHMGTLEMQAYAVNNCSINDNCYYTGTQWKYRNNGYANSFYFYNDGFNIRQAASGNAGDVFTWTNTLQISGNASDVLALATRTPLTRMDIGPTLGTDIFKAGAFEILAFAVNNTQLFENAYYNSGYKYRANGYASRLYYTSGGLTYSYAPSGSADGTITWVDLVKFGQGTNDCLGLGAITSPVCRLDLGPVLTSNSLLKAGGWEIASYAVNNGWIFENIYYNGGYKYRANGYGLACYFSGGAFYILTAGSGTAGNAATLTERFRIVNGGNIGIGQSSPSAYLHIKAGTATASTAPIKLTSGTLLSSAEAGAIEFNSDDFYVTITTSAARKGIVLNNGSNLTSGKIPIATTNGRLIDGQTPLAGTKVYYVADSSGGATTRKLTFINGILTSET